MDWVIIIQLCNVIFAHNDMINVKDYAALQFIMEKEAERLCHIIYYGCFERSQRT